MSSAKILIGLVVILSSSQATASATSGVSDRFAYLSPHLQERIVCSIAASIHYDVPVNIVLAVAEKEAGKPGQWVRNTNGTHDVGAMQFNTRYLQGLTAQYGIMANDVAAAGCYAYDLAAWRLHGHLQKDTGDIWTRAANYHSRTPNYNAVYRADLISKANKWAKQLDAQLSGDVEKMNATLAILATSAPKVAKAKDPVKTKSTTRVILNNTYIPRQIIAKAENE
jgi:hypothetical protein